MTKSEITKKVTDFFFAIDSNVAKKNSGYAQNSILNTTSKIDTNIPHANFSWQSLVVTTSKKNQK